MKKIIIICLMLLSAGYAFSQTDMNSKGEFKTIFEGKSVGGYGGFGFGYSEIDNREGVSFDARAGIVLGHYLALGFGGSGFVNSYEEVQSLNAKINLVGGYGGAFAELFLFPRFPVHLSFPVTGGIGAIAASSWIDNDNYSESQIDKTSVFMIVEPGVELEFNLTNFFRLAVYLSHRFTTDIDLGQDYSSPFPLDNFNAGLRFKFGKF